MRPQLQLKMDCPFYRIFEDGWAPVISPAGALRRFEGAHSEQSWMLDLSRCTPVQIEQVATTLCELFRASPRDVIAAVTTLGVPIRESQVACPPAFDLRFFL